MPWIWTPDADEEGLSLGQVLILSLNDWLGLARQEFDRRHYHDFLEIAIRRLTAEWRLALEDAADDPRSEGGP